MIIKTDIEINIPDAPAIPRLTFRHYRGATDHAIMAGLVNTANEADRIPEASSAESMAHYYANPKNLDPYRDVLITEVNGEPACYSRVYWLDQDSKGGAGVRIYRSVTFMHPAWRRKKLGRAILSYNEKRIKEIAAEHPERLDKFIEITIPDAHVGAAVLLERSGYQATRYFFVMKRDLSVEIPGSQLPESLEIRPVKAEHYRQVWDAIEEAFTDHWGFTPRNEEDYQNWLKHPDFNPSLWVVAWDGEEIAGAVINVVSQSENESLGYRWAWTEPIGVRRPWRRRGLGRALLLESQREMKAIGMDASALEVDTQNTSNALHLYESCGYVTVRRWDLYRKKLN